MRTATLLGIVCLPFFVAGAASALDLSSPNFILRDPISVAEGGQATSTNFQFFSSTGQTAVGEISSTTFLYRSGFLYFPIVTTPVLSATAGNAQASFSWTAVSAALGFTVSGYDIGQAAASGGPYAFTTLGNVLSTTRTGLTNGTTYYFVLRALDTFGNAIATSTEASVAPTGGGAAPAPAGGAGGLPPPLPAASGTPGIPEAPVFKTEAIFRGVAYPNAAVTLLKDGVWYATVSADERGVFEATVAGASPGQYLFALYAVDSAGRQSAPVTLLTTLTEFETVRTEGIFISPTLGADKSEVRLGESIIFFGESAPNADVTIFVAGEQPLKLAATTDARGRYAYELPTGQLRTCAYDAKAEAVLGAAVSALSRTQHFLVGARTVVTPQPERCGIIADINHDCRVDMIDFSILLFWFDKPDPLPFVDFNSSGRVDLADFSILIYYWTG
jgi:hypothetical protein